MKYLVLSLLAAAAITAGVTQPVHAEGLDLTTPLNLDQIWQDYINDAGHSCGCQSQFQTEIPTPTPTPIVTPTPTPTPTPTATPTPTPTPTPTATPTPTPTPSPTATPVVSAQVLTVLPATGAGDAATVISGVFAGLSALAHVALRRK